LSADLGFTAILLSIYLAIYLSIYLSVFSPATLRARRTELNQNWPHARK